MLASSGVKNFFESHWEQMVLWRQTVAEHETLRRA